MKKGGVAREIKGCRRRCLHHPAPTCGGKRGAKGVRRREDHRDETQHTAPRHTSHRIARTMVCTPHAKLAARSRRELLSPRANHANALRYSPTVDIPATTCNIRSSDVSLPLTSCYTPNERLFHEK